MNQHEEMTDVELLAYMGTDAARWAEQWCMRARDKHRTDILDEGWMIGWFANAIEAGRNHQPEIHEPAEHIEIEDVDVARTVRAEPEPEIAEPEPDQGHEYPQPEIESWKPKFHATTLGYRDSVITAVRQALEAVRGPSADDRQHSLLVGDGLLRYLLDDVKHASHYEGDMTVTVQS